jgi:putative AbiEi antitoxin of type IV toxin-antitoxin system
MGGEMTTAEQVLARMARGTHGVVTRRDLLSAGLSPREIERRVEKGLLIPEYRGVYRVGHQAPSVEARYLAAVRAAGDGAVLCGRAAGYLLWLLKASPPPPEVMTTCRSRRDGVRRTRRIDPRDITTVRGIAVTTVPRTLVDVAAVLSLHALARACHEAGVRYRTTPRQTGTVLARRPNSPGAGNLRAVMRGEVHVALSKLERAFLERLRDAGLPLPITNKPAGGRRVDCRWPDRDPPLTVELLSYQFHNSRHAWEMDNRRAREAHARRDDFRSYTSGDVLDDPRRMLQELRELLLGEV